MTKSQHATRVLAGLRRVIPRPETELEYRDPYQLLIAVILSAQCTDVRVNKVTPALFEAFPTVADLARAEPEQIYEYIKSVSYPNNKSKHLAGAARMMIADFGGNVPASLEDLEKLPGVGRKTAQVVASVAFDIAALPVDTHVFRVANRIGLADEAKTPLEVERRLKAAIDKKLWGEAHHLLILHGRYTCTARRPKCDECVLTELCRYYKKLQSIPAPLDGLDSKQGRYFCKTCGRYFNKKAVRQDRYGVEQTACPSCDSMNVFQSKSGRSTKQVKDYRV